MRLRKSGKGRTSAQQCLPALLFILSINGLTSPMHKTHYDFYDSGALLRGVAGVLHHLLNAHAREKRRT